jgi:hypothetical protein
MPWGLSRMTSRTTIRWRKVWDGRALVTGSRLRQWKSQSSEFYIATPQPFITG